MRKKNYKGRCEKRIIEKCNGVCRTYDAVQYSYADILQKMDDIVEIRCNVPLDDTDYSLRIFETLHMLRATVTADFPRSAEPVPELF